MPKMTLLHDDVDIWVTGPLICVAEAGHAPQNPDAREPVSTDGSAAARALLGLIALRRCNVSALTGAAHGPLAPRRVVPVRCEQPPAVESHRWFRVVTVTTNWT